MQTIEQLNEHFGIKDHLHFEEHNGLVRIVVNTAHAKAALYTQGAHLVEWTPAGQKPGLFLSPKANIAPGKAIRGGIPVIFPWFGPKADDPKAALHGFARTSVWTVESTHFGADGDVVITLTLDPQNVANTYGVDHFHCGIRFVIAKELTITLEITNHGPDPLVFEEGFHTYFAVGHPLQTTVEGLDGTEYLDKRDGMKKKTLHGLLHFTRDVDQVHINTASQLVIHDAAWKRDVHIEKEGSNATVCWNPSPVLTPNFADLAEDSWEHFVCVEVVNALDNKVTLAAGATHSLSSTVRIA